MANTFFKTTNKAVKYWYVPLVAGILFIALGIFVLSAPVASFLLLSVIFSISFLFTGITNIFLATSSRNELENWGWMLVGGILNVVIGILLIINPAISIVALAYYIGFWAMFRSIMSIAESIDMRHYGVSDWGYLMALGVLGIFVSFMLIANPTFAGISLVVCIGIALAILGVYSVFFALKLKKIHIIPENLSEKVKEEYKNIHKDIKDAIK